MYATEGKACSHVYLHPVTQTSKHAVRILLGHVHLLVVGSGSLQVVRCGFRPGCELCLDSVFRRFREYMRPSGFGAAYLVQVCR